jgi:hypothetical protein
MMRRLALAGVLPLVSLPSLPRPTVDHDRALAWQEGPALPVGRDHHITFVTTSASGATLWVAGGTDYRRVLRDVWSAAIAPDGSVREWREMGVLPAARAGLSVASDGRTVVISGGQDSSMRKMTDVWTAAVLPDGKLGPWREAPPLPGPRFHHAMTYAAGWIYVTGGLEGATSVASVMRARLGRDGQLGQWESLPDLPRPRSHHAMVVRDGALYLIGGLDGNPAGANTPLDDVLAAEIRPDGTLARWQEVSRLPHAYATHASAVADDALWLFGGVEDNARVVDVVLRAPFATTGALGAWSVVSPGLPTARSHVHQLPVVGGRAYSVGGSNRRVVSGTVIWADLEATP